jgi:FixJ family two-component response regulator
VRHEFCVSAFRARQNSALPDRKLENRLLKCRLSIQGRPVPGHDHQELVAIVDDEEALRRALSRLLRAAGYAVASYENVAEFLQSPATPDCLLLDLYLLLRTNGASPLGNLVVRGRPIPTILITGSLEDGIELPAGPAPTCPVLQKPVDAETLLDTVTAAICSSHYSPCG